MQRRWRLFRDLSFAQLRRCQVETVAEAESGMVLAIGLRCAGENRIFLRAEPGDEAERHVLAAFNQALAEFDPDVIEGHGIFSGPLDRLRARGRALGVPSAWGRFGQRAAFRTSRLKAAERWIDFTRCDAPGRAIVDTALLVQLYDVSARDMSAYGRRAAAEYFGLAEPEAAGNPPATRFNLLSVDPAAGSAALAADLREIEGLTDLLLPTYVEQARQFPIQLQDATLRGTTSKIDLLFLEAYYHARQACPLPPTIAPFEGGFAKSFREGVFRHVLHFDVASLYPSILLALGMNPRNDALGIFIPLLQSLREYRLRYKALAREAPTEAERAEARARQNAFKILINSFYGYLGFAGARFGDGDLAAEVTRRGRELLQSLIGEFDRLGCTVLEADTDGLYVASEAHFEHPEPLLAQVARLMPPGIDLEFDGRYAAMVCYKAKNYALYDGTVLTLRGSAFRSRAMEPFLQKLTDRLLRHLVGADPQPPGVLWTEYREKIARRELPVADLAKSESLSQAPDAYERSMAEGGKPRRAAAEAALQLEPRPRMGERISYYIGPKAKGRSADWQRARPLQRYDRDTAPYDPSYYLEKLQDWRSRYARFLPPEDERAKEQQGELL
jgi:DNA polymerase elongation subunit (family B)